MKNILLPLVFLFYSLLIVAQPATNIPCQPNTFFALQANKIHLMQMNATSVTDLGQITTTALGTLNSLAFGNDIITNSTNRTFYSSTSSGLSPCFILRYTGTAWDTLTSDTLIYHQAAAYGPFIYFQHAANNGGPNDGCIARLNTNGTLTKIFTDTSLRFTVGDIAVDTLGNIYCFRGPQIGNTTELTVINPNGTIINSFSTTLNNLSTFYGSMFLNGTLFLGWGTTNGEIFPIQFNGSSVSLGTGRPVPVGVSYKDLANCHDSTGIFETGINFNSTSSLISTYPNPVNDYFIIENASREILTATLYSVDGRRVADLLVNPNINHLEVAGFPKGLYFLLIRNKEIILGIEKIIKN